MKTMNNEDRLLSVKENIILDKSFAFALKIVESFKYLTVDKKEYILSKQLLRSGTSIGANLRESSQSITKRNL